MAHADISQTAFIEAIRSNMAAYINCLREVPDVEIESSKGVIRAASGASVAFMNPVVTAETVTDPGTCVDETIGFFTSRNLPFAWYDLRDDHSAALHDHLMASGAVFGGDMPGMGLDLNQIKAGHRYPTELRIIKVDNNVDMQAWNQITAEVYDVPEYAKSEYSNAMSLLMSAPEVKYYIGILNDNPAAALMVVTSEGIAGIYSVATMPEARGKGIGTEITYRALLDAHNEDNCQIAVLEASKMGEPVYRRLGFEEYRKVGLYVKEMVIQAR